MEGPGLGRELRKDPQDLTGLVCVPGASPPANESRGRGALSLRMGFWCPNATEPRGLAGKVTSWSGSHT